MSQTPFVELVLTCGSWQEAQRIADQLLEQKLVACVEFLDIQSKFAWHGNFQEEKEVKLVMQSAAHLFRAVEAEVAKLHSYDTFVLAQLPLTAVSEKAQHWLEAELKQA